MKERILGTTNNDESVDSTPSSGDGVTDAMLDEGDNSFSFYEIWNNEMHMLKCAIDKKINNITQRSQKEIERIAATVTGVSPPKPYKLKTIGPKIPPKQWTAHRAMMKQQYQQQQEEANQRLQNPKFIPMVSIEPRMDGLANSKSAKHRDIRISPSGRSQTTATSDKTIPQSNVSSRQKQPHTIINVLSIPEETSLQQTTDEENENDVDEALNEDDDENSASSRSSSSSVHTFPMVVVTPVVDEQSVHDAEKSDVICDEDDEQKTIDIVDEPANDIPSMMASLSLSSGSRSETGSPAAAILPVVAFAPPKQSYRERHSRTIFEGRRQQRFYPWLVERVQPQHGTQDAPTAPTNGKYRPDAPASSIVRKSNMTFSDSQGQTENELDTTAVIAAPVIANEVDNDMVLYRVTNDNATKIDNSSTRMHDGNDDREDRTHEPAASSDKLDCVTQVFNEALTSLPSVEETLPSVTDNEIAAFCRTLDDDEVTNQNSKKTAQQRKHRKPPSPETFVMARTRKTKRKKVSNSPTKGFSKTEKNTETLMSPLDSIEESTIDTFSKIDDKETTTEAPSTDIVPYNNDRRIQPEKGGVEPSLIRLEYVTERKIKDPYNDEGLYTGILILGKPETHGTMKYKDGRYYTGSWKRGRWNGHGKAIFANGDTYTGDYVHDQRHGVGRYEWSDDRVYDGRFENDQREGHGTYSWPNGSVYCGGFHLGLRHGYGTYTYEDGSVYSGEWRNGRQNGNGECIWADGRCFRGDWLDGRTHSGVETRADGTIRHDRVRHKNRAGRPKDHYKNQSRAHNQAQEIEISKSPESDQSFKPNLECLRQGKSLVRSLTENSNTQDESIKSKSGVVGIVSTSMSE